MYIKITSELQFFGSVIDCSIVNSPSEMDTNYFPYSYSRGSNPKPYAPIPQVLFPIQLIGVTPQ